MNKADEKELAGLHGILAQALRDKIANGEATAADLSVAAKFLKDNGIDCYGKQNENVSSLAETMDFPIDVDDDEAIVQFPR